MVLPEVKTDIFLSIVQLMSLGALWISEGYSAVIANGRAGPRSKIQQAKHVSLDQLQRLQWRWTALTGLFQVTYT